QYMSPEQARGEPVDARADICSLGLVLYFLLTGRSLYRGDNAFNLLVQAAQGLTPELLPSLEKVPKDLAHVLRVALEPDREQRFRLRQRALADAVRDRRRARPRDAAAVRRRAEGGASALRIRAAPGRTAARRGGRRGGSRLVAPARGRGLRLCFEVGRIVHAL